MLSQRRAMRIYKTAQGSTTVMYKPIHLQVRLYVAYNDHILIFIFTGQWHMTAMVVVVLSTRHKCLMKRKSQANDNMMMFQCLLFLQASPVILE